MRGRRWRRFVLTVKLLSYTRLYRLRPGVNKYVTNPSVTLLILGLVFRVEQRRDGLVLSAQRSMSLTDWEDPEVQRQMREDIEA
jgi:hypothetical protein